VSRTHTKESNNYGLLLCCGGGCGAGFKTNINRNFNSASSEKTRTLRGFTRSIEFNFFTFFFSEVVISFFPDVAAQFEAYNRAVKNPLLLLLLFLTFTLSFAICLCHC